MLPVFGCMFLHCLFSITKVFIMLLVSAILIVHYFLACDFFSDEWQCINVSTKLLKLRHEILLK